MLCAARLTPLHKSDGGVRPITVDELIYRLCAKIILRSIPQHGALLPGQFGVGSSGATEPIIRLIERFVEQVPELSHVALLDFYNIFNEIGRPNLAHSIRTHAQRFYRTASWCLNEPTPLLTIENRRLVLIPSAEGTRQGDPLAIFFFSFGARE
ncbi:hypothetical protein A4X13_0g7744 [Tilletia indica]|uniref:Uncharacterized protein n=1 Tax=Tilletia indica TaxID=43049 RepID=A0A177T3J6_9BASI|nr:hypothetical protein A4X13_0g7744 [Tilletia indica]